MIKPNEIRIGNLVTDEFYDSFKTIIVVDSVNEKGINLHLQDDGNFPEVARTWIEPEYTFDKLRVIPITEQILIEFGFENKSIGIERIFKKNYFYWYSSLKKIVLEFDNGLNGYDFYTECEFVHQLQNLYFDLTGEELKKI